MAEKEYIEREAALKILENSLTFCKRELSEGSFRQGCIAATQDDIGNIKHIPTADVAPRAEVAREIFREIYAEIFKMLPLKVFRLINGDYEEKTFESGKESALHGVLNCIAELEKEYTEGKKCKRD